jgi:hypothetical protein
MGNSRIFKIDESRSIVCEWQNTRYGFRHLATLMVNGYSTNTKAKCCYYNRTWESFEFESVLRSLLEDIENITAEQRSELINKWNPYHRA